MTWHLMLWWPKVCRFWRGAGGFLAALGALYVGPAAPGREARPQAWHRTPRAPVQAPTRARLRPEGGETRGLWHGDIDVIAIYSAVVEAHPGARKQAIGGSHWEESSCRRVESARDVKAQQKHLSLSLRATSHNTKKVLLPTHPPASQPSFLSPPPVLALGRNGRTLELEQPSDHFA
mmetsp:Transcript_6704/g.17046  ORF Transcript_6704/g.17046 Transcript_6704/m.17046 type:complete len:177 (+) Transcript_6704:7-537(+)